MSLLPIIIAPDQRLKLSSEPVGRVDDDVRRLMNDMLETMHAAPGIGLSAVQVGVTKRIIVLDLAPKGGEARLLRLVDPEITWLSPETVKIEEGCLSFPEHFGEITRPSAVKARYTDENNQHPRDRGRRHCSPAVSSMRWTISTGFSWSITLSALTARHDHFAS